jgi:hypothetical protein
MRARATALIARAKPTLRMSKTLEIFTRFCKGSAACLQWVDGRTMGFLIWKRPGEGTQVRFMPGCLILSIVLSIALTILVNLLIRLF